MEMIPALSVLTATVIVLCLFIAKLSSDQLASFLSGSNLLLPVAALLFVAVVVLHLFVREIWTADVLKFIAGLLVGVGAGWTTSRIVGGVDVADSVVENSNIVGRDYFDQRIDTMEADVAEVRNAVIHQSANADQLATKLSEFDADRAILLNTVHERHERLPAAMASVIEHWRSEGWKYEALTSDYAGADGVLLVFSRPCIEGEDAVRYYHGSRMERLKYTEPKADTARRTIAAAALEGCGRHGSWSIDSQDKIWKLCFLVGGGEVRVSITDSEILRFESDPEVREEVLRRIQERV